MADFIGYAIFPTLSEFIRWHGECVSPALGTVNQVLGFDETKETKNYTIPKAHPNADYPLNADGWPYGDSITDEKRVYAAVDSDCPEALRPATLYTYDEINAMGFIPTFYQTQARSLWSKMVSWFTG